MEHALKEILQGPELAHTGKWAKLRGALNPMKI